MEVFTPEKNSIRVVKKGEEFLAYVEEMPTVQAYGETPAKAWANCVKLVIPTRMRVATESDC
jgi:hypothetical protein